MKLRDTIIIFIGENSAVICLLVNQSPCLTEQGA
jgi:hypothetical protein